MQQVKFETTNRQNNEQPTLGFVQAWQDVINFGCSSLSTSVRADGILLGFCRLSCTFVFQSAEVPGGRFSNPMPAQSPIVGSNCKATS